MRNSFFTILISICFSMSLTAQIQTNELPPSYSVQSEKKSVQSYSHQFAKPNLTTLEAEDRIEDPIKNIPWRFGTIIPSDFNLSNSGEWSDNDNNKISTWKLRVYSKDALSINLNFSKFKLPSTSKLFIYNDNYSDVLGALTSANNKIDNQFSIRPIKGEAITLELIVPTEDKYLIQFQLSEVIYGYRDLHQQIQTIFQSSASCNINVNCSEGDKWQDVKRSIAMITTSGNSRFCTGALINNLEQDSLPYLLTAAHCGVRNNSVFIFNYESSNCNPNTDGSLSNSISGSSRRGVAVNFGSDFDLRLLSSIPPTTYNVYYSGWSIVNTPALKATCIHHPSGDVKKLAIDENASITSGYYSTTGITHWQVSNWEKGTTEGGSSGAPLFDQNQRIIGQLNGGDAACGNQAQDYFGKFSYSWANSPDTARQLKRWLDPNNTGIAIIDGLDPNPAVNNLDVSLIDVFGIPNFFCGTTIAPYITIKNVGNSTVDSIYIDYTIGNNSGSLLVSAVNFNRNNVFTTQFPPLTLQTGVQSFTATLRLASGTDQDLTNNSESKGFRVNADPNPGEIIVTIKTDNYGAETSWDLADFSNGNTLFRSQGYPTVNGGGIYRDTMCIYDGCFRFNLRDSQGDGFNDPNGNFGNGYALVTINGNDTLFFENSFFNSLSSDTFCIQLNTSLSSITKEKEFTIYPNPIQKGETLNVSKEFITIRLFDLTGKLLLEKFDSKLKIPTLLTRGVYLISVQEKDGNTKIKKVIIQ